MKSFKNESIDSLKLFEIVRVRVKTANKQNRIPLICLLSIYSYRLSDQFLINKNTVRAETNSHLTEVLSIALNLGARTDSKTNERYNFSMVLVLNKVTLVYNNYYLQYSPINLYDSL